jgi:hypothetical protein
MPVDQSSLPQAAPVRVLERRRRLLPALRMPSSPAVLAASGIASVVAVLTLRVLRSRRVVARSSRKRKQPARNIIGTRSFLVDVHVLGR